MFALDTATGLPAWVWRPREVDPEDLSFGAVPNLFEIEFAGETREVIGVGNKDGNYYVLDRDGVNELTGVVEPYWAKRVVQGGAIGGLIASAAVGEGKILFSTAVGLDLDNPQLPAAWGLEASTGLAFAVENMYPWRASSKRGVEMYLPGWDPSAEPYANTTIDLSHAAIAASSPIEMAERLGPRLRHVHLTDGTGSAKDEHLVPGRGSVGAAEFLQHLAGTGFAGEIVVEINTRKAGTREEREDDLRASLEFAREHFLAATPG